MLKPKKSKKVNVTGGATEESDEEPVLRPKRPRSAWVLFNTEKTAELVREGRGKEAMKLNSAAWAEATEEEKAPYAKQAAEEDVRYKKQLADFGEQGWFEMEDGSKSTDAKNAGLIKKKPKKSKAEGKPAGK